MIINYIIVKLIVTVWKCNKLTDEVITEKFLFFLLAGLNYLKNQYFINYDLNSINFIFFINIRFQCLDSSRPWMCYWICHSLRLMKYQIEDSQKSHIAQFLNKFVDFIFLMLDFENEDNVIFIYLW